MMNFSWERREQRLRPAIAVLAVHVAVVSGMMMTRPQPLPDDMPTRRVSVALLREQPKPAPATEKHRPEPGRDKPLRSTRPVTTTSPAANAPASADTTIESEAIAAPTAGQPLDFDGMKRAVRTLRLHALGDGSGSAKIMSSQREDIAKFRRKAQEATRPDCLTAFQGMGVLALVAIPLAVVVDKKDSGCKF